jgi:acetolactate synthase-1/2/3 large subunit
MMNSQEIETAIRLGLSIVIVILNDNGFGMVQWKQEASHKPAFGLNFSNPDFVLYAQSYGARGYVAATIQEFEEHLIGALAYEGVTLIECPIDYSENIRVFTKELSGNICPLF